MSVPWIEIQSLETEGIKPPLWKNSQLDLGSGSPQNYGADLLRSESEEGCDSAEKNQYEESQPRHLAAGAPEADLVSLFPGMNS